MTGKAKAMLAGKMKAAMMKVITEKCAFCLLPKSVYIQSEKEAQLEDSNKKK